MKKKATVLSKRLQKAKKLIEDFVDPNNYKRRKSTVKEIRGFPKKGTAKLIFDMILNSIEEKIRINNNKYGIKSDLKVEDAVIDNLLLLFRGVYKASPEALLIRLLFKAETIAPSEKHRSEFLYMIEKIGTLKSLEELVRYMQMFRNSKESVNKEVTKKAEVISKRLLRRSKKTERAKILFLMREIKSKKS